MTHLLSSKRSKSWGLVALAVLCSFLFTYLFSHYELDDALIYKRYIANALTGNGLVYNAGEFWNALTSPLYAYLYLFFAQVTGDIDVADFLLRMLSLFLASLGGAMLLALYLQEEEQRTLSQAVLILLVTSSYYFLSTFGLETLLFVGLLALTAVLFEKERHYFLGIVAACLLLTRGEGVFFLLLLLFFHLKQGRPWPRLLVYFAPVVLIVCHFLFSLSYYGSATPHTLTAKLAQGASGYWGDALAFAKGIKMYTWYFGDRVSLLFVAAALVTLLGVWKTRACMETKLFGSFSVLYGLFFLLLNIPFYHWYYGPFLFLSYFFLVCGVFYRSSGLYTKVATLVLMFFVGSQGWYSYQASKSIVPHPYVVIGTWLAQNTPKESKIATAEIGALGWYSKRYMIDILGLVTPGNAQLLKEQKLSEWLSFYEPDFLVIHDPPWPLEEPSLSRLKNESRVSRVDGKFPKGFALWKVSSPSME